MHYYYIIWYASINILYKIAKIIHYYYFACSLNLPKCWASFTFFNETKKNMFPTKLFNTSYRIAHLKICITLHNYEIWSWFLLGCYRYIQHWSWSLYILIILYDLLRIYVFYTMYLSYIFKSYLPLYNPIMCITCIHTFASANPCTTWTHPHSMIGGYMRIYIHLLVYIIHVTQSCVISYASHRAVCILYTSHRALCILYASHRAVCILYTSYRAFCILYTSHRALCISYTSHRAVWDAWISRSWTASCQHDRWSPWLHKEHRPVSTQPV
jgi:hypothetical protein